MSTVDLKAVGSCPVSMELFTISAIYEKGFEDVVRSVGEGFGSSAGCQELKNIISGKRDKAGKWEGSWQTESR